MATIVKQKACCPHGKIFNACAVKSWVSGVLPGLRIKCGDKHSENALAEVWFLGFKNKIQKFPDKYFFSLRRKCSMNGRTEYLKIYDFKQST